MILDVFLVLNVVRSLVIPIRKKIIIFALRLIYFVPFCVAFVVCCSTYNLVDKLLQFVNFTDIMSTTKDMSKKEAAFALAALMEIPTQYKASQGLRPS